MIMKALSKTVFKKILLVTFVLICLIQFAEAEDLTQLSSWRLVSEIHQSKKNALELKFKSNEYLEKEFVMQRIVKMRNHEVPLGTLTQSIFKRDKFLSKTESEAEAQKIAESIRKTINAPKWEIKKKNGTISFVADWLKINRLVRIVYKDLGTHYSFSIATSRRGFAVPIFVEAILVQDLFAEKFISEKAALNFDVNSFLKVFFQMSEANAESIKTLEEIFNVKNNNFNSGLNSFVGRVSSGTTIPSDHLGVGAADVLKSALSEVKLGIGAVNNVGNQVGRVGDQIGTINETVKNLASPKNALLTGLAGGIGFAAGGAILHFAIDGTVAVGLSLFHNIVGTLTDDERDRMRSQYGKAYQNFEKSAEAMSQIERELDEQFVAIALASDNDPSYFLEHSGNNLVSHLGADSSLAQAQYKNSQDRLAENGRTKGFECPAVRAAANEVQMLGTHVETYKNLYDVLKKLGGDSSLLCRKIQAALDRWTSAEFSFYLAKQQLLLNYNSHLNEISGSVLEANESTGNARKRNNFCNENLPKLKYESQQLSQPDPNCVAFEVKRLQAADFVASDIQAQATQACMRASLERMNANLTEMLADCQSVSGVQKELSNARYLDTAIGLAKAESKKAKSFFNDLAQSDCREGLNTSECDGKDDGEFTKQQKRYAAMFARAKKFCPKLVENTPTEAPSNAPERAAASSEQPKPKEPVKCSFICNIYQRIASFFK
jgi:hypothetical protein